MNNRVSSAVKSKKAPLQSQNMGKKMELQRGKLQAQDEAPVNQRQSTRERKLALLQDVDKLKEKLRHEENVHRALERAFNRPLGALPRLPPYLPQDTLELVAEVAVLEEEVTRLEKQVVNFRQGLYEKAVYISSRRNAEDSIGPSNELSVKSSKRRHSRSFSQSEINSCSQAAQPSPSLSRSASSRKLLSEDRLPNAKRATNKSNLSAHEPRKEPCFSPYLNKEKPPREKKTPLLVIPVNKHSLKHVPRAKNADPIKAQCRVVEQAQESSSGSSDDRFPGAESEANKISGDILKCLISIFVRLSTSNGKTMDSESFSSVLPGAFSESNMQSDIGDCYYVSSKLKTRDIGPYKNLVTFEAGSVDLNQKRNASFLIRRLKILLGKLASVKLEGLTHHQKLAFWINTYHSCMMNGFLEHGAPESPDMVVALMQKATIAVGGHLLNAITIEHFVLRLPYHLKHTCSKSARNDQVKVPNTFGLEWSEPLVTFALSCGSWSSPAVRVYTASHIETELETAKRDYLQAAVAISLTNKLMVPKLLDWYILDFAKDLDALLDWVCLQLPDELRTEALRCLERRGKEPLSDLVQVMPYDFSFRYIICR